MKISCIIFLLLAFLVKPLCAEELATLSVQNDSSAKHDVSGIAKLADNLDDVIVPGAVPDTGKKGSKQLGKVESLYGTAEITIPLIKDMAMYPEILRLKGIDVSGPNRYFRRLPAFSMFQHAFGTYVLLKRFNVPEKEMIAGILQFVAHSAFAEFGSFVFDTPGRDVFQLDTQEDFIKRTRLSPLLAKYKLSAKDIFPLNPEFNAINKSAPDLSAQAIDKVLMLAYSYNLTTQDSIKKILDDLRYEQGRWFFVTQESANKLGMMSLYFQEKLWGAPVTFAINRWIGSAIKTAITTNMLTLNSFRVATDGAILKKLLTLNDPLILTNIMKAKAPNRFFTVVEKEPYGAVFKPKFQALDPFVKDGSSFKRLSAIDTDFKKEFDRVQKIFQEGIKLEFKEPNKAKVKFS